MTVKKTNCLQHKHSNCINLFNENVDYIRPQLWPNVQHSGKFQNKMVKSHGPMYLFIMKTNETITEVKIFR